MIPDGMMSSVGAINVGLIRAAATDDCEAEASELGAEEGAHGDVDEELEAGIGNAEPEDAKVEERDGIDPVSRQVLVQGETDEREPTEPESHH